VPEVTSPGAAVSMRGSLYARVITLGEWFFRQRSWTPIPFLLLLIFCPADHASNLVTWVPGLLVIALGEGLRLWGVAVIGKESRTRGGGVVKLATEGPYAHVRNPLYLGNLLLTIGAALISQLLWMVPVVIVLYLVQYIPIVLWEERVLAQRLGAPYASYCQRVPRWIPTWHRQSPARAAFSYQWRAALWSERSTFGSIAFLVIVMLAKANLPRLMPHLHAQWTTPEHRVEPSIP